MRRQTDPTLEGRNSEEPSGSQATCKCREKKGGIFCLSTRVERAFTGIPTEIWGLHFELPATDFIHDMAPGRHTHLLDRLSLFPSGTQYLALFLAPALSFLRAKMSMGMFSLFLGHRGRTQQKPSVPQGESQAGFSYILIALFP